MIEPIKLSLSCSVFSTDMTSTNHNFNPSLDRDNKDPKIFTIVKLARIGTVLSNKNKENSSKP